MVEALGGVIGNGEAAGHAEDVLGACSPEGLVDFSSEELVEDSVVHFLGWMLLRCILYREKDTVSVSLSRMRHIIMCSHLSPSSSSTEIDYDHITSH